MAKRCASSRMRCTRYSACDVLGSTIGSETSFTYSSSNRLASPASGMWPTPMFRITSCAAETCPLPPSTITRSGTAPNDSSNSATARGEPVEPRASSAAPPSPALAVRPRHRPDPEAAVLRRPRPPFDEDDHGAHGRGALDVRDVVALDAQGERWQVQLVLQLVQRLARLAGVRQPLRPRRLQRLAGVFDGGLDQGALSAALRRQHLHLAPAPLREPLLDERLGRHGGGGEGPAGDVRGGLV